MADQIADLYATLRLDSLRFRVDLDAIQRRMLGFRGTVEDFSGALSSIFKGVALTATVGSITALTVGLYKGVSAATDLTESLNKVGVTFGAQASVVTGAAEEMANQFGVVRGTFLDAASSFGLIAQGAGITGRAAADLSVDLSKLAVDASSFYNVPLADALGKIRSGLVGESEPLRSFGVLLSENAVAAEALRLGLARNKKEIDDQDKVLARSSLIRQGLAKAQGDLARTQGSPANLQREIGGRAINALADVGQAVTPIYTELLTQINSAIGGLGDLFAGNRDVIESWSRDVAASIRTVIAGAQDLYESFREFLGSESGRLISNEISAAFTDLRDTVNSVVGTIGDALATLGVALRNWDSLTQITALHINQSLKDIGTTFRFLGDTVKAFLDYFSANWKSIFQDAITAVLTYFKSFGEILARQFEQIRGFLADPIHFRFDFGAFNPVEAFNKILADLSKADFKTPVLKLPQLQFDHTEIDRQVAAITDEIARREADRVRPKIPGPVAQEYVPPEPPRIREAASTAAKVRVEDLQSFAKRLQVGALSGKDQSAERTAAATEKTAVGINDLLKVVRNPQRSMPLVTGPT